MSLGYSQRAVAGGRGRAPPARWVCCACTVTCVGTRAPHARATPPAPRAEPLRYLETLTGHATNQIQPKPLAIVASPRLTTHPQTHQTQPSSHDWFNMRPALQISSLGAYRVEPGRPRFFPQPAERTTSQPAAALDELELERRGLLCCAARDALGRLERHLQ